MIVNAASPRDVDTALSNGYVMVRGGEPVRVDETQLAQRLTAAARNAAARLSGGSAWTQTFDARIGGLPLYRVVFPKTR